MCADVPPRPAAAARACRLRSCRGEIRPSEARVEVAVSLGGAASAAGARVDWEDSAALCFHADCWRQLRQDRAHLDDVDRRLVFQAAGTAEKFDAEEDLISKARQSADILRASEAAICFTGAGISTSAGLGDYRGKSGKWTLEARGVRTPYTTVYESLRPTYAHEAVAKLVELGRLAYVVSQNADGLHHLSGVPYDRLSDVHGSAFTERCPRCGARYVRDSYVPEDRAEDYFAGRLPGPMPAHIERCRGCGSNHWTGRECERCGGPLRDTVVSFGDGLEECVLRPAFEAAAKADACLSLGSTMSIGPSNEVVAMQRGPLIVCVRQDTEMDGLCSQRGGPRAYGDCDDFMRHLMRHLLGDRFDDWEAALPGKRAAYDAKRPVEGKQRGDIFVKKV